MIGLGWKRTPYGACQFIVLDNLTATERRALATKATTKIAVQYGITSDKPVILKDSNNTVIHLAPSPVVAKVATSKFKKHAVSNLEHELKVALHLVETNAPVVPPASTLPPVVYSYDNLEVTFWQHNSGEVRDDIDHPELVAVLKQFHTAFASYGGVLNPFTDAYENCRLLLEGECLSSELSKDDRIFLLRLYDKLSAELQKFEYECVPVHNEIHGGNILWTGGAPLLIDFESCCRGPRELDFLAFSETNLLDCVELNRELMIVLGHLRSFRVAVSCWLQPDRSPEIREAAEYHLKLLHSIS